MISTTFNEQESKALLVAIPFVENNPTRGINEATKNAFAKLRSQVEQNASDSELDIAIEFTPEEAKGFFSAIGFLKSNPKSCWNPSTESAYQNLKSALDIYKQKQPKLLEVDIL